MAANFLIGLREGLEAALIIGVLIAYLIRSRQRAFVPAVWSGLGVAVAISLVAGAVLTYSQRQLPPRAAEILAGVLGLAATALMTWMVFWMARTARSLHRRLEDSLGRATGLGWGAVFTLTLFAVGREGLEVALFLWTQVNTTSSAPTLLGGALLGILVAAALGWAVYRGTARINLKRFFTWTSLILIVLAAGVFAHGLHELQEAGAIHGFESVAFDVSNQVPVSSWYGALLTGILGFSPAPTILEVGGWLAYLVVALVLYARVVRRGPEAHSDRPAESPREGYPQVRPSGESVRVNSA